MCVWLWSVVVPRSVSSKVKFERQGSSWTLPLLSRRELGGNKTRAIAFALNTGFIARLNRFCVFPRGSFAVKYFLQVRNPFSDRLFHDFRCFSQKSCFLQFVRCFASFAKILITTCWDFSKISSLGFTRDLLPKIAMVWWLFDLFKYVARQSSYFPVQKRGFILFGSFFETNHVPWYVMKLKTFRNFIPISILERIFWV